MRVPWYARHSEADAMSRSRECGKTAQSEQQSMSHHEDCLFRVRNGKGKILIFAVHHFWMPIAHLNQEYLQLVVGSRFFATTLGLIGPSGPGQRSPGPPRPPAGLTTKDAD